MRMKLLASTVLIAGLALRILPVWASPPDVAPIMPLAAKSLLLDIARAGERLVAVGERGHVLYSDDGGAAWHQATVPTTQMLTAVDFVDAQRGWAVGHDGLILFSEDGGEHWRLQRDGLAVQHQLNLEHRERAYRRLRELEEKRDAAGDAAARTLELALEDARMDLEDAELALEEPVFTEPLLDVYFRDPRRGWAVGAFGRLVTTADGGEHWLDRGDSIDNPDEYHLNAVTGDGGDRVFIAGEGGLMLRSLDGGANWERLDAVYAGSWFGALYDRGSGALLVFGLRGNLFRSTDFGASWRPLATDNRVTLAGGSVGAGGEIVIVGGVGTVLFSDNGGLDFEYATLEDRLSLSSGLPEAGDLVLVGQGGARVLRGRDGE